MPGYTPKNPVKDLWSDFVRAQVSNFDWETVLGETDSYGEFAHEVTVAEKCDTCGKWVVITGMGEYHHNELDSNTECEGYFYNEGPQMNYAYPISLKRVGSREDAALAIGRLPLCIVEMHGRYDDETYLALTGGGMDLSWEICEAYMRLGYLPPIYFARLPGMAGMKLDSRHRWVLAGMRRALQLSMNWEHYDLVQLRNLRAGMRENG